MQTKNPGENRRGEIGSTVQRRQCPEDKKPQTKWKGAQASNEGSHANEYEKIVLGEYRGGCLVEIGYSISYFPA